MKKIILFLCFLFLTLILLGYKSLSTPEAVVKVESKELSKGSTANIAVRVENIPSNGGLGAYDIKITFNPSVIQVLDVVGGSSPFNKITAKNINNAEGWARFNHFITATQGPTGSITIAYLKIKTIGEPGTSTNLGIKVISLVDAKTGDEIPRTTSPGKITIKKPPPTKKPSYIGISINTTRLKIGECIEVQGDIEPDRSGVIVTLIYIRPDYTTITHKIKTNSTGGYKEVFIPDLRGEWKVKASWPGDEKYKDASSKELVFRVIGKESHIFISISPPIPEKNENIKIYGFIEPPFAKVPITIYMEREGIKVKLGTVSTNEKGCYYFIYKVTFTGCVRFFVEWPGKGAYEGAKSKVISLFIKEKVEKEKVILPGKEEVEVRASSNSSKILMKLKIKEKRIIVNVSGPRGTIGVLDIFIPIRLLKAYNSSIEKVLFLLDGKTIKPSEIKDIMNGYLVRLTYTHSTRRIDIYYTTYAILVKVLDYEGKPIERAEVNVTKIEKKFPLSFIMKTNSYGIAYFEKIPAGTYKIYVYYGPKVSERIIEISKNTSIIIPTTVGEIEAKLEEAKEKIMEMKKEVNELISSLNTLKSKYESLKAKHEVLKTELDTYKKMLPVFMIISVAVTSISFIIGYFIGKGRRKS